MTMKNCVGLILSAGKVHPSMFPLFGEISSSLVPIYGKPILCYILESFYRVGIRDVFVTVGFQKERVMALSRQLFADRMNLYFVPVDFRIKPGSSFLVALQEINRHVHKDVRVFMNLGDTFFVRENIISEVISLDENVIFVSEEFDFPEFWCFAKMRDKDGKVISFIDKPEILDSFENMAVLVGGYCVKLKDILRCIPQDFHDDGDLEISQVLSWYLDSAGNIRSIFVDDWIDVGHLNKYHYARKKLIPSREFNQMFVDEVKGVITKRSFFHEKIFREYQWYIHLPSELQLLAPRVVDYSVDEEFSELKLEYYGYPSLMELWVYGNFDLRFWKGIISKLMDVWFMMLQYKVEGFCRDSFKEMYCEKILDRILEFESQVERHKNIAALLLQDTIVVNGCRCFGVPFWREWIKDNWQMFVDEDMWGIIHGDMCFANVLYDTNTGILRLIDPRGYWGHSKLCGDGKYDLAKIRHSVHGGYEMIISDQFVCSWDDSGIDYGFPVRLDYADGLVKFVDMKISEYISLPIVKMIEGLLFLSMLPLHRDSLNRQMIMFAIGLETLQDAWQDIK